LLPQSLAKPRRELVQFVDITWITLKRECQLSCLFKIAIVNLEALHRRKSARQNVEDLGIKSQRCDEGGNAKKDERTHTTPDQRATLRDSSGNEIADAHETALVFCNRDSFTTADAFSLTPRFSAVHVPVAYCQPVQWLPRNKYRDQSRLNGYGTSFEQTRRP
jgi:hypothetical protein